MFPAYLLSSGRWAGLERKRLAITWAGTASLCPSLGSCLGLSGISQETVLESLEPASQHGSCPTYSEAIAGDPHEPECLGMDAT